MAARDDLTAMTASPLPPLRTHGYVALLDDVADYVRTLEDLLSYQSYSTIAFTDPAALHAFMDQRIGGFAAEQRLLSDIWRAQLEAAGTVAEKALQFFARPDRLEMPLVLVTDYAMPTETGLSVCARPEYGALERVLLTGVADNVIAVSAFNAGAIDQFVQKQGTRFPQTIVAVVEGRLVASAARRGVQLANALPRDFTVALTAAGSALRDLLDTHDVQEYMILGQPQGVLGITGGGNALWVQLETESSLADLDDVLELANASQAQRGRVAGRQALVPLDFMKQLGEQATEQPARVLSHSRDPLLVAAVHPLVLPKTLQPYVVAR